MSTNCPYCASPATAKTNIPVIHFNEREFSWNKCSNCQLIFILPFLSTDDLSKLYGENYHEKYYFNYTEDYSSQVNLLKKYPGKKLLDYGCGDGGFLKAFSKQDYETTGVEYSAPLIAKLHVAFPESTFMTVDEFWNAEQTSYDIIHLADVLEHMNEPSAMIEKLAKRLAPGGYFFIEGPLEQNRNFSYFFRCITYTVKKMIDQNKVRVKEPYHVTFSTATNQRLLFERSGLHCLHFSISEEGWPYIDQFDKISSPWLFVQWLIAKISIGFSSLLPGWGNRFTYIGKKMNT